MLYTRIICFTLRYSAAHTNIIEYKRYLSRGGEGNLLYYRIICFNSSLETLVFSIFFFRNFLAFFAKNLKFS